MKTTLGLSLTQTLSLTPQLTQAIYLLQLSTIDLNKELQETVNKNPFLEMDDTYAKNLLSQSYDFYNPYLPKQYTNQEEINFDNIYVETEDLRSHLLWQLNLTSLSQSDQVIADAIIENTDDDGFLSCSLDEILLSLTKTTDFEITLDEIEAVLILIQRFDPVGVCSRNLKECLLIQLDQLPENTPYLHNAMNITKNHLNLLATHKLTDLGKITQYDKNTVNQAIRLIQSLNPKPGSIISPQNTQYIIPDIIIYKHENRWKAKLNPDWLPKLKINQAHFALIGSAKQKDQGYIKKNLQEARWLIKSLQVRNLTLLRVANYITQLQNDFFDNGDIALKPLTLNDIATNLELHESTISRVTTNKYLSCQQGTFELKYFFSTQIDTKDGNVTSSKAIKALIKKVIENESSANPISDQKITAFLEKQGINIARRTIAKYRKALKIPTSSKRKYHST